MRETTGLLLALLWFTTAAGAEGLSPEEEEVWALEKSYYQFVKNNDPVSYLSLFHEGSIGWPTMDLLPKGRDRVSQWIATVHSNPSMEWNYEIERLAIQSFGNVVVVHYRLRAFFLSSQTGEVISSEQNRISHSWLRVGETWQIISGMGGRFN